MHPPGARKVPTQRQKTRPRDPTARTVYPPKMPERTPRAPKIYAPHQSHQQHLDPKQPKQLPPGWTAQHTQVLRNSWLVVGFTRHRRRSSTTVPRCRCRRRGLCGKIAPPFEPLHGTHFPSTHFFLARISQERAPVRFGGFCGWVSPRKAQKAACADTETHRRLFFSPFRVRHQPFRGILWLGLTTEGTEGRPPSALARQFGRAWRTRRVFPARGFACETLAKTPPSSFLLPPFLYPANRRIQKKATRAVWRGWPFFR